jgi:WD40 repeat protein
MSCDASVTAVRWSFDGHFCISSSVDRSARIWAGGGGAGAGRADALVVIKGEHHAASCKVEVVGGPTLGVKSSRLAAGTAAAFGHSVVDAAFFYQDKYILLGMGGSLQLYKYRLPPALSGVKGLDDLQKLKKEYKYKCIHSLQSSAQTITAAASLNEILSPTVLAAGTDKSITVFDVAHSSVCAHIADAHSRAVHCLAMNRPSNFTSHAAPSYDLFLSAATDGCVKLWDMRICKAVARYAAHANRTLPLIKATFSPCMRFVACGGEDKNVTLYGFTCTFSFICFSQYGRVDSLLQVRPQRWPARRCGSRGD